MKKILKLDAELLISKAKELLSNGKLKEAESYFQRNLTLGYEVELSYLYLGIIYYYKLNFYKSILYLETVLTLNYEHDQAHFYLGQIALILNNKQEALSHLTYTIENSEDVSLQSRAYMDILTHLEVKKADEYRKLILTDYLIQIRPDEFIKMRKELFIYIVNKDYEAAKSLAVKMFEVFKERLESYLYLLIVCKLREEFLEAKELLLLMLRKFPYYKLGFLDLSQISFTLKEYKKSSHYLSKVLKQVTHNPYFYFNMGLLCILRGKYQKATYFYCRGLNIKPDSFENLYNLGLAWQKQKMFDKALDCYQRAQKLTSKNAIIYYNQSLIYFHKNQYIDALFSLVKSYQFNENFQAAKNNFQYISLIKYVKPLRNSHYYTMRKFIFILISIVLIFITISYFKMK